MMRTTLSLPDDVYEVARSVANARKISLGDAIADLVRQGLRPSQANKRKNAFPTFAIPPDARPITLEQTLAAEDEI